MIFSYFSLRGEVLLMSTHNICFHGEIRKKISTFRLKQVPYSGYFSISSPLLARNLK